MIVLIYEKSATTACFPRISVILEPFCSEKGFSSQTSPTARYLHVVSTFLHNLKVSCKYEHVTDLLNHVFIFYSLFYPFKFKFQ